MTFPINPFATFAPRGGQSFSWRTTRARPWAVASEIIALIVLAITAILAVLPRARAYPLPEGEVATGSPTRTCA